MADPIDRKPTENLHKIMEVLEAVNARNKELEKKAGQVEELSGALARLQERCDKLDKELPKGEKIFRAAGPASRDDAINGFGRCITEAWRLRQYGKTSKEFQEFVRASGPASQANQEGQTDLGGVVVPTITYNQIARIIGEASIVRKVATIVPMTSNVMTMPTRSSGPSVSWPGELTAPTSHSSVLFSNPQLTAKTLLAVSEVSMELDEDSIVALEPFFATLFAEAVAQEENKQAFYSTSPFTGVCNTAGIASTTFAATAFGNTFAEVTHTDLVKTMFSIDSKLVHKGTWIMHATAFQQVFGLKDSQNRPIYATSWASLPATSPVPDQQIQAQSTVLLGRPCFLSDVMPSTAGAQNSQVFAVYGDMSKIAMGDRKALTVEWSDQPFFENGSLALRVRERVAFKPLIASCFGILRTRA